tara:strand:+ start:2841 stop:3092 length:252 start_codon:yes stop_codon:yes gene_type:complete
VLIFIDIFLNSDGMAIAISVEQPRYLNRWLQDMAKIETSSTDIITPIPPNDAVQLSDSVYWIGALEPTLRVFDIFLETANGTT